MKATCSNANARLVERLDATITTVSPALVSLVGRLGPHTQGQRPVLSFRSPAPQLKADSSMSGLKCAPNKATFPTDSSCQRFAPNPGPLCDQSNPPGMRGSPPRTVFVAPTPPPSQDLYPTHDLGQGSPTPVTSIGAGGSDSRPIASIQRRE